MSLTWTVLGAGVFVGEIADAIESAGDRVTAVVLNVEPAPGVRDRIPAGIEVLPLERFVPRSDRYCFGFQDPAKDALLEALRVHRLEYAPLLHARAAVSPRATLGQGCFVGAGAVIGAHAVVGAFSYVVRSASIGHDTRIGERCRIGPGATIAGRTTLGARVYVGAGATVIDGLRVADGVVIGAGATVVDDLLEPGTYVGTPARLAK